MMGQVETFTLTAETEYGTKAKPSRLGNFRNGSNVSVDYVKQAGEHVATSIFEHRNGIA